MKKMLLLIVFWSTCLHCYSTIILAKESDETFKGSKKLFRVQPLTMLKLREENTMAWTKHLQYTEQYIQLW